jgi:hypothetical protein
MDLSLDPVITRIKLLVPATFKKVGGAADLGAALRELKQEPAAFVIQQADAPQANTLANGVSQFTRQRFAVLIGISNLRDASGEKAQTELAPIRDTLFTQLIGWAPDADRDPCTYAGGRIIRLSDRVLWWQDNFDTAYYIRKV